MLTYLQSIRKHRFQRVSLFGSSAQQQLPDEQVFASPQSDAVVKAFKLQSSADLQVVLNAMVLSECVYKLVDMGESESAQAATFFINEFPSGLATLKHMQGAALAAHHRYMLGSDDTSLYVVFMGTKHVRDVVADANLLQEAVWQDGEQQSDALAHRGFLARSRRIPVEALFLHARRHGKRLVLCGHSLGGAVALLCTLRLLRSLNEPYPPLQCICFGTPAIGNAALAALVYENGWEDHILNFILPEDMVPRMLALPAAPTTAPAQHQQDVEGGLGQAKQGMPSTACQRLYRLKDILLGNKPVMKAADCPGSASSDQQSRQQLDLDLATQQAADTQHTGLRRLSGGLQNIQARLKARMQQQSHQSNTQELPQQHATISAEAVSEDDDLVSSQQQAPNAANTNLPETKPGKAAVSESKLQKLARLAWRCSPPLDAAIVHQQDSSSTASDTEHSISGDNATPGEGNLQSNTQAANASEHHLGGSGLGNAEGLTIPEDGDRGIALDSAVKQPASLLQSITQRLQMSNKQTSASPPAFSEDPLSSSSQHSIGLDSSRHQRTGLSAKHPKQHGNAEQPNANTDVQQTAGQASITKPTTAFSSPTPVLQQLSAWQRVGSQIGQHINNAVQGASSRARAVAALLPTYPAYVHIGSHQVLLPASPALTEAVQSAGQQGPAEQQRQALLMHSMAAYRGRALAMCRSAMHWESASQASEVTLAVDLAPPLSVSQATVTIPPLPYLAPADIPQLPSSTQQPARAPGSISHSQAAMSTQSQPKQGMKPQLLPWVSQQPPQQQQTQTQQEHQQPEGTNSERAIHQRPLTTQSAQQQQQQQPHMPGISAVPSTAESQQAIPEQQQRRHKAGSTNLSAQSGRWFAPANMRWPVQSKPQDTAKMKVQIKVHGSAYGMPVIGQLQVLGQIWLKVKLNSPNSSTISPPSAVDSVTAAATQAASFTKRFWQRLPWTQAAQSTAGSVQSEVMLFDADVPISMLQKLADCLEDRDASSARQVDVDAQQQLPAARSVQSPELLTLRLQTDFVTQQHAVQARLPVVWILGPDAAWSQVVWQCLTQRDNPSAELRPEQSISQDTENSSQSFSQRLNQNLDRLKLSGRDAAAQQASLLMSCASRAGVQYVHISSASMPFNLVLSCVRFVMLQMFQPDAQQKMTGISARLRAVYHRQQLQQLQQSLHEVGVPSAVLLVVGSATDATAAADVALSTMEASTRKVVVLGAAAQHLVEQDRLHSLGIEQWVMLPSTAQSVSSDCIVSVTQQLRAAMSYNMSGPLQAKL